MMAMDIDNWKWYIGVNGTWGNSANLLVQVYVTISIRLLVMEY